MNYIYWTSKFQKQQKLAYCKLKTVISMLAHGIEYKEIPNGHRNRKKMHPDRPVEIVYQSFHKLC